MLRHRSAGVRKTWEETNQGTGDSFPLNELEHRDWWVVFFANRKVENCNLLGLAFQNACHVEILDENLIGTCCITKFQIYFFFNCVFKKGKILKWYSAWFIQLKEKEFIKKLFWGGTDIAIWIILFRNIFFNVYVFFALTISNVKVSNAHAQAENEKWPFTL